MTPDGGVPERAIIESSAGTLLGGRLWYAQPVSAYRTGIEPVLLAAAVPARPGEAVLEAGSGAGAGMMCLAARIAGLRGVALEREPALAALAAENLAANRFDTCRAVAAEVARAAEFGPFDHAFANPPWHDAASSPSAVVLRARAKQAVAGLPAAWCAALAAALRRGGTLTLILPAAILPAWLAALQASGCGAPILFPLWPRPGRAAKLMIVQARRSIGGRCALLPGLILHADQGYTAAADAVLRDGAALGLIRGTATRAPGPAASP